MIKIELRQVEADLPHFLEQVAKGHTLTVCKDDVPIAEIRPVGPIPSPRLRPLGLAKGLGEIQADFNEPLPPDLLAAFSGEGESER